MSKLFMTVYFCSKKYWLLFVLMLGCPIQASVDLHMHLTMEVPLSPFFTGSLLEKAKATSWQSRLESRADAASLNESGVDLVVTSFIANPLWGDPEVQLEQQMNLLNEFIARNPQWKIATEPDQVKNLLAEKNKVIILSMEGAFIYKNRIFFEKVLDKYSIRIVTPMHFTDVTEVIGKPAKQAGFLGHLQDFFSFFFGHQTLVSKEGEELINLLFEKKIWIDLSHSSENLIESFLKMRPPGYPILITHSVLQKYYGTDRGTNTKILDLIEKEGGILGLLPSADMLMRTPVNQETCGQNSEFLVQWNEIKSQIGIEKLFVGSDLNSPIPSLPPTPLICPEYPVSKGWSTAADLKSFYDLESTTAAEVFVNTWKKVRNVK